MNRTTRHAMDTSPNLASVRLLYVAKTRRERRRERIARFLFFVAWPTLMVALFIVATNR